MVRVLSILLLALVMDLGSPVLPEPGDASEDQDVAAHERRRLLPFVHRVTPTSTPAAAAVVALAPPLPALPRSPARTAVPSIRKIPPPLPDPSSASEDH